MKKPICSIMLLMIFVIIISCSGNNSDSSDTSQQAPEDVFKTHMRELDVNWNELTLMFYQDTPLSELSAKWENIFEVVGFLHNYVETNFNGQSEYNAFMNNFNTLQIELNNLYETYRFVYDIENTDLENNGDRRESSASDNGDDNDDDEEEGAQVETWDDYFLQQDDPFYYEIDSVNMACINCHEDLRTFPLHFPYELPPTPQPQMNDISNEDAPGGNENNQIRIEVESGE